MTLFSPLHATKVLAVAVALGLCATLSAEAGGRDHRQHNWQNNGDLTGGMITLRRSHTRHDDWRRDRRRVERGFIPRRERRQGDGDFFGGSISVYNDRGNGRYLSVENDGYLDQRGGRFMRDGSHGRIIRVVPGRSGCSFEAGVCVIRR
jgi:hypothetical protein